MSGCPDTHDRAGFGPAVPPATAGRDGIRPAQQLLDTVGADKKLVKKALAQEGFRRQVVVAAPKDLEAPAALLEAGRVRHLRFTRVQ